MIKTFDWKRGVHTDVDETGRREANGRTKRTHIQNMAWGVGDACAFAWMMHSIWATHPDVKCDPWHNKAVLEMMGVKGEQCVSMKGRYPLPMKGAEGRGWLRNWLWQSGYEDTVIRRPPVAIPAKDREWAESLWSLREREMGGDPPRIAVFPRAVFPTRVWPVGHFEKVVWALRDRGFAVVTADAHEWETHGFPDMTRPAGYTRLFALIERADLVIGNDSGPVHIAGLLGVPALAVCGPTPKGLFFEHLGEVKELRVEKSSRGCVACNWSHAAGFVKECEQVCVALKELEPSLVVDEALQMMMGGDLNRSWSVDPELTGYLMEHCAGEVAVETGGYDGGGSTKELLTFVGTLDSIECNPAHWRRSFARHRTHRRSGKLRLHLGNTLEAKDRTGEVIASDMDRAHRLTGGPLPSEGTGFYEREMAHVGETGLLAKVVKERKPGLVLLDSAGGVGYREWLAVRDMLPAGCHLALDDTRHVKHALTMRDLEADERFEKKWEGTRRHGSAVWRRRDG